MQKQAIIYDLDNTIYSVASISGKLFAELFALLEQHAAELGDLEAIKTELKRRPYQHVARDFGFSDSLTQQGCDLLNELSYEGGIRFFEDYPLIRQVPGERFLVTTGFTKLQWSKIDGMGIREDFKEIHVVDPALSTTTKKDVFLDIMARHQYTPPDLLVVGDDPASEIKAAKELGIETVLIDKEGKYTNDEASYRLTGFQQLYDLFQNL